MGVISLNRKHALIDNLADNQSLQN